MFFEKKNEFQSFSKYFENMLCLLGASLSSYLSYTKGVNAFSETRDCLLFLMSSKASTPTNDDRTAEADDAMLLPVT